MDAHCYELLKLGELPAYESMIAGLTDPFARRHCLNESLCWLASKPESPITHWLISHSDIDLNHPDECGLSPLLLSIQARNTPLSLILISQTKIDINVSDCDFNTALMYAVRMDLLRIVQALVLMGSVGQTLKINTLNCQGNSALNLAVQLSRHEIVSYFLQEASHWHATFDPNVYERPSQPPLLRVLEPSQLGTLSLFCAHPKTDINIRCPQSNLTALQLVIQAGQLEVLKYLCMTAVDFKLEHCKSGDALSFAIQNGQIACVSHLLRHYGRHFDINQSIPGVGNRLAQALIYNQGPTAERLCKLLLNQVDIDADLPKSDFDYILPRLRMRKLAHLSAFWLAHKRIKKFGFDPKTLIYQIIDSARQKYLQQSHSFEALTLRATLINISRNLAPCIKPADLEIRLVDSVEDYLRSEFAHIESIHQMNYAQAMRFLMPERPRGTRNKRRQATQPQHTEPDEFELSRNYKRP